MNVQRLIIVLSFFGLIADVLLNVVYAEEVLEVVDQPAPVLTRELLATVEVLRRQPLVMEVGGKVVSPALQMGQRVNKGQLILAVDDREAQARVIQAAADVARIAASRDYQQALLHRAKKNLSRGVIAAVELEQVQSQVTSYSAQYDFARAALDIAKLQLQKHRLYAPFDGVLQQATPFEGEYLQAHQTRIELLDDQHLKVSLQLSPQEAMALHQQQFHIAQLSQDEQPLIIYSSAPAADRDSGLIRVELLLSGATQVTPGQAYVVGLYQAPSVERRSEQILGDTQTLIHQNVIDQASIHQASVHQGSASQLNDVLFGRFLPADDQLYIQQPELIVGR